MESIDTRKLRIFRKPNGDFNLVKLVLTGVLLFQATSIVGEEV